MKKIIKYLICISSLLFTFTDSYSQAKKPFKKKKVPAREKTEQLIFRSEEDFYKWTLPTFTFLDDKMDTLEFNSGIGPIALQKSNQQMPNIIYSGPSNND